MHFHSLFFWIVFVSGLATAPKHSASLCDLVFASSVGNFFLFVLPSLVSLFHSLITGFVHRSSPPPLSCHITNLHLFGPGEIIIFIVFFSAILIYYGMIYGTEKIINSTLFPLFAINIASPA